MFNTFYLFSKAINAITVSEHSIFNRYNYLKLSVNKTVIGYY